MSHIFLICELFVDLVLYFLFESWNIQMYSLESLIFLHLTHRPQKKVHALEARCGWATNKEKFTSTIRKLAMVLWENTYRLVLPRSSKNSTVNYYNFWITSSLQKNIGSNLGTNKEFVANKSLYIYGQEKSLVAIRARE